MKIHRTMYFAASVLLTAVAFTSQAASGQSTRGPAQDQLCVDQFRSAPAAATCQLTKASYMPGGGGSCQLWASCRRNDGSFSDTFNVFRADRVYRVCNDDGKLVAGCPG